MSDAERLYRELLEEYSRTDLSWSQYNALLERLDDAWALLTPDEKDRLTHQTGSYRA